MESSPVRTPTPTRASRPTSTEFKSSNEFRPLYLVERNRQVPELEENLPSLPSSHTTSRGSSVKDPEDGYEWTFESYDRNQSTQKDHQIQGRDLENANTHLNNEYLDSGQTTPRAGAGSPTRVMSSEPLMSEPLDLSDTSTTRSDQEPKFTTTDSEAESAHGPHTEFIAMSGTHDQSRIGKLGQQLDSYSVHTQQRNDKSPHEVHEPTLPSGSQEVMQDTQTSTDIDVQPIYERQSAKAEAIPWAHTLGEDIKNEEAKEEPLHDSDKRPEPLTLSREASHSNGIEAAPSTALHLGGGLSEDLQFPSADAHAITSVSEGRKSEPPVPNPSFSMDDVDQEYLPDVEPGLAASDKPVLHNLNDGDSDHPHHASSDQTEPLITLAQASSLEDERDMGSSRDQGPASLQASQDSENIIGSDVELAGALAIARSVALPASNDDEILHESHNEGDDFSPMSARDLLVGPEPRHHQKAASSVQGPQNLDQPIGELSLPHPRSEERLKNELESGVLGTETIISHDSLPNQLTEDDYKESGANGRKLGDESGAGKSHSSPSGLTPRESMESKDSHVHKEGDGPWWNAFFSAAKWKNGSKQGDAAPRKVQEDKLQDIGMYHPEMSEPQPQEPLQESLDQDSRDVAHYGANESAPFQEERQSVQSSKQLENQESHVYWGQPSQTAKSASPDEREVPTQRSKKKNKNKKKPSASSGVDINQDLDLLGEKHKDAQKTSRLSEPPVPHPPESSAPCKDALGEPASSHEAADCKSSYPSDQMAMEQEESVSGRQHSGYSPQNDYESSLTTLQRNPKAQIPVEDPLKAADNLNLSFSEVTGTRNGEGPRAAEGFRVLDVPRDTDDARAAEESRVVGENSANNDWAFPTKKAKTKKSRKQPGAVQETSREREIPNVEAHNSNKFDDISSPNPPIVKKTSLSPSNIKSERAADGDEWVTSTTKAKKNKKGKKQQQKLERSESNISKGIPIDRNDIVSPVPSADMSEGPLTSAGNDEINPLVENASGSRGTEESRIDGDADASQSRLQKFDPSLVSEFDVKTRNPIESRGDQVASPADAISSGRDLSSDRISSQRRRAGSSPAEAQDRQASKSENGRKRKIVQFSDHTQDIPASGEAWDPSCFKPHDEGDTEKLPSRGKDFEALGLPSTDLVEMAEAPLDHQDAMETSAYSPATRSNQSTSEPPQSNTLDLEVGQDARAPSPSPKSTGSAVSSLQTEDDEWANIPIKKGKKGKKEKNKARTLMELWTPSSGSHADVEHRNVSQPHSEESFLRLGADGLESTPADEPIDSEAVASAKKEWDSTEHQIREKPMIPTPDYLSAKENKDENKTTMPWSKVPERSLPEADVQKHGESPSKSSDLNPKQITEASVTSVLNGPESELTSANDEFSWSNDNGSESAAIPQRVTSKSGEEADLGNADFQSLKSGPSVPASWDQASRASEPPTNGQRRFLSHSETVPEALKQDCFENESIVEKTSSPENNHNLLSLGLPEIGPGSTRNEPEIEQDAGYASPQPLAFEQFDSSFQKNAIANAPPIPYLNSGQSLDAEQRPTEHSPPDHAATSAQELYEAEKQDLDLENGPLTRGTSTSKQNKRSMASELDSKEGSEDSDKQPHFPSTVPSDADAAAAEGDGRHNAWRKSGLMPGAWEDDQHVEQKVQHITPKDDTPSGQDHREQQTVIPSPSDEDLAKYDMNERPQTFRSQEMETGLGVEQLKDPDSLVFTKDNHLTKMSQIPSEPAEGDRSDGYWPTTQSSRKQSKKEKRKSKKSKQPSLFEYNEEPSERMFANATLDEPSGTTRISGEASMRDVATEETFAKDGMPEDLDMKSDDRRSSRMNLEQEAAEEGMFGSPKPKAHAHIPRSDASQWMIVAGDTQPERTEKKDFDATIAESLKEAGFDADTVMTDSGFGFATTSPEKDAGEQVESFRTTSRKAKKKAKKQQRTQGDPSERPAAEAITEDPEPLETFATAGPGESPGPFGPTTRQNNADTENRGVSKAVTDHDFDRIVHAGLEEAGFDVRNIHDPMDDPIQEQNIIAPETPALEFGNSNAQRSSSPRERNPRTPSPTQAWQTARSPVTHSGSHEIQPYSETAAGPSENYDPQYAQYSDTEGDWGKVATKRKKIKNSQAKHAAFATAAATAATVGAAESILKSANDKPEEPRSSSSTVDKGSRKGKKKKKYLALGDHEGAAPPEVHEPGRPQQCHGEPEVSDIGETLPLSDEQYEPSLRHSIVEEQIPRQLQEQVNKSHSQEAPPYDAENNFSQHHLREEEQKPSLQPQRGQTESEPWDRQASLQEDPENVPSSDHMGDLIKPVPEQQERGDEASPPQRPQEAVPWYASDENLVSGRKANGKQPQRLHPSLHSHRDSAIHVSDSPEIPQEPVNHQYVRDSGYHDASPVFPGPEGRLDPKDPPTQSEDEGTFGAEDPRPRFEDTVSATPSKSIFGPESPSSLERSPRSRSFEIMHNPSPVDPTTKNRASYLFSSPPDQGRTLENQVVDETDHQAPETPFSNHDIHVRSPTCHPLPNDWAQTEDRAALPYAERLHLAREELGSIAEASREGSPSTGTRGHHDDTKAIPGKSAGSFYKHRDLYDRPENRYNEINQPVSRSLDTSPSPHTRTLESLDQPKRPKRSNVRSPTSSEVANNTRPYMRNTSGDSRGQEHSRSQSVVSDRSITPSGVSNRSGTPTLRRVDRSVSSDLRAANKRDASLAEEAKLDAGSTLSNGSGIRDKPLSNYQPLKGIGKDRRPDMSDGGVSGSGPSGGVFVSFLDVGLKIAHAN